MESKKIGSNRPAMPPIRPLLNAVLSDSSTNYPVIINGFLAKGIPADQIMPRQNVFTKKAWLALGRKVRDDEQGVAVVTYITNKTKQIGGLSTGCNQRGKNPYKLQLLTAVFHKVQTEPLENEETNKNAEQ